MDEKDIEILLSLSELKNFTKAADRLYITQPAMTGRIKRLEAELGVPLFYRTSKGVRFTPMGETAVEYAKDLSITMRRMREHVKALNGDISGSLHIGCANQFARYRLPELLSHFLNAYPQVNVDVVADRSINIQRELMSGAFSVAIIRGDFKWHGCRKLLSTENYCLIYKEPISHEQLVHTQYIHQKTNNLGQEQADSWVHMNLPSEPKSRIESNDIELCISMVKQGMGWAILPEICLQNFTGYREPIHAPNGEPIVRSNYLCYKSSELKLPQVQKFIEYTDMYFQS